MSNIKKHYKIFIAISIVIILISSFIVYDITPKNNITSNDNAKHIDVKYFAGSFLPILFDNTGNHTAYSYYVHHNN